MQCIFSRVFYARGKKLLKSSQTIAGSEIVIGFSHKWSLVTPSVNNNSCSLLGMKRHVASINSSYNSWKSTSTSKLSFSTFDFPSCSGHKEELANHSNSIVNGGLFLPNLSQNTLKAPWLPTAGLCWTCPRLDKSIYCSTKRNKLFKKIWVCVELQSPFWNVILVF